MCDINVIVQPMLMVLFLWAVIQICGTLLVIHIETVQYQHSLPTLSDI